MNDDYSLKLREIILNTRRPLVLHNFKHNWLQFQNGLNEWCKNLDIYRKEPLYFECMRKNDASTPQWERKRTIKQMDAEDFLQNLNSEEWNDYWFGMNYKRAHQLPSKCTEGVDFSCFGFPMAHKDCTFWLSSKGANTPCHYDTYGCNIVVQIYGKKLWILFSPDSNLTPTRIPYEESSVYCVENFYAPYPIDLERYKQFSEKAYTIELQPNDVLIVPRHWWHYVETIETSLSVNTWIPLDVDIDNQIEEAIVQYLMENFTKTMIPSHSEYILNPNQIMHIDKNNCIFDVLKFLLNKKQLEASSDVMSQRYYYLSEIQMQELLNKCDFCTPVQNSYSFYNGIIQKNSLRWKQQKHEAYDNNSPLNLLQELLISSICKPHIIHSIKEEFLKQWKNRENLNKSND